MFNPEGTWVLMEQHRHAQIRQACSVRLAEEATRDRASLLKRVRLQVSALLIDIGCRLKAGIGEKFVEKPHDYVAAPQDRIFA